MVLHTFQDNNQQTNRHINNMCMTRDALCISLAVRAIKQLGSVEG